jgi:hypothetical protein
MIITIEKIKTRLKLTYFFPRYGPTELKITSDERGIKPRLYMDPLSYKFPSPEKLYFMAVVLSDISASHRDNNKTY